MRVRKPSQPSKQTPIERIFREVVGREMTLKEKKYFLPKSRFTKVRKAHVVRLMKYAANA